MDSLSRALVIAIQYLGSDRNDAEFTEDDDLKIVEEVASIIQSASVDEKAALVKAAKALGLTGWAEQIGISLIN